MYRVMYITIQCWRMHNYQTLMEVVVYLQVPLAHANGGLPTNAMAWSPTQAEPVYD